MKQSQSDPQASGFPEKLSQPARRALATAGILRLEQLTEISETELKQLHGMGPKGIEQLRTALAEKGLTFGTD